MHARWALIFRCKKSSVFLGTEVAEIRSVLYAIGLFLLSKGICFRQRKARGDDRVFARIVPVFDVGGTDDGAIGEQFNARIAAVATGIAVKQLDAVEAVARLLDVVIGSDPGHKVTACGRLERLIAEGDNPAAILCADAHVAVTREPPTGVYGRAPGLAFIAAEHH